MFLLCLLKQDNDTDQKTSSSKSESNNKSTWLSEIQVDYFDYQVQVLILGQTCQGDVVRWRALK